MMGATQVDRYGNQNIAAIGDYAKPRAMLLGYRGAPGNTINDVTSYWVPNHTATVVCERVDTVCGIGYDRAADLGPEVARFHEIRRVAIAWPGGRGCARRRTCRRPSSAGRCR